MQQDRRRFLQGASVAALLSAFGEPLWANVAVPRFDPGPNAAAGWPRHNLFQADTEASLEARLLRKPVLATRLLSARDGQWSATATANVAASAGADGLEVIRLTSPMLNVAYLKKARAPNGSSDGGAGYLVEGDGANFWRLALSPAQDWDGFNQIAFEIYVHDTGLDSYAVGVGFVDAAAPAQGPTGPLPLTFAQNLVPGRWNAVVWEIPQLPRSKVVEFAIFQPLRGPDGRVDYEVRNLAVRKVEAESFSGWEVAPGRIAYNHVGYLPAAKKLALVDHASVTEFELVVAPSGRSVARFPVEQVETRIGSFSKLDFSTYSKPGRYRIRAGSIESREFTITPDLWIRPVSKLLNFFYADRCGFAVPGIHGVCHQDLRGEHEGVRKPLNGGWHDAGNGSQGSYRTALCTDGLLSVYAALAARGDQPELAARALEEASWGLDWLLRTRFGKGYRVTDVGYSIYTDGKIGDYDDIVRAASFDPFENLLFVSVSADAARLLKTIDPARSAMALDAALDDYGATMKALPTSPSRSADRNSAAPFQQYAYGVLAAVALQRATKSATYLEDAIKFGDRLLACQHTGVIGESRISGFFYEDETHRQPSHELHTSFADAAPRALAALIDALPRHPRVEAWRSALSLYAQGFLLEGSKAAAPYDHVPNTVWHDDQFARFVESSVGGMRYFPPGLGYKYIPPIDEQAMRAGYAREYAAAMPLADGVRLRTFPIPPDPVFHGATTIQLAITAGLVTAAETLSQPALRALAERQLDWVFGANPFSNCLMYGEGYDFPSQFQAIARDMVGSVPVGMDNSLDKPFWPTSSHFTFKEMWVVPAGHLLRALAPLLGQARKRGR